LAAALGVVVVTNPRVKGAAAERELVELLRARGYDVHRTPHSGALEWLKGDLCGLPGFHIEAKRQETIRIGDWCKQAEADCGENVPLVVFRRSWEPWRVTLRLTDFLDLLEKGDS
jgi:hypothetical protein